MAEAARIGENENDVEREVNSENGEEIANRRMIARKVRLVMVSEEE